LLYLICSAYKKKLKYFLVRAFDHILKECFAEVISSCDYNINFWSFL